MHRARLPQGFTLLQVTPRLDGGGVEAVTLDVAAAVAAAGARSLVASQGGRLEPRLAEGGAELFRLPAQSRNPLTMALNGARLARIIGQESVSLVHVRSRAPAFSALWAGRATTTPVIATYHGIYGSASPLKRWYNGVMTRGDAVIANSQFTGRHILKEHRLDPAKLVVIPEGVDTGRFDPAQVSEERVAAQRTAFRLGGEGGPVILQAARLTGWKGQAVMIQALARLARPDVTLVLVGPSEGAAAAGALRAAALAAGVADQVRILGAVDDMPAAYLAADLVVAPSTAPESFGRAVIEACAMGRPVLASPLGATAETIIAGETGWLVEAGNPAAWAEAIKVALDLTPEARGRLGVRARTHAVTHYSLAAMCEATFGLYRRLLEARR